MLGQTLHFKISFTEKNITIMKMKATRRIYGMSTELLCSNPKVRGMH